MVVFYGEEQFQKHENFGVLSDELGVHVHVLFFWKRKS